MRPHEQTPQLPVAEVIPFPKIVERDRDLSEMPKAIRIALEMMNEADYANFLRRIEPLRR